MLLIGICGASGSGKSTLSRELIKLLGSRCLSLNQDAYYVNHPDLTYQERVLLNYDAPEALDHESLYQDIRHLMNGIPITRKAYDFSRHIRADTDEIIAPPEILILDGIHAFYDDRLTDLMYLKIFVHADPDVCVLRRVKRDMRDRGRKIEDITSQYLTTVKPMFEHYIRFYEEKADIIVNKGGKNARINEILASYLKNIPDNTGNGNISG